MHISQFNTDTDYIKNDNNFTDTIKAADKIAMYDECAKKLLAHKSILAHILIASIGVLPTLPLIKWVKKYTVLILKIQKCMRDVFISTLSSMYI